MLLTFLRFCLGKPVVPVRKVVNRCVAVAGVATWALFSAIESFALGTAEEQHACTADVFRLCSSENPDVDRIVACMQSKKTDLSISCRAIVERQGVQPAQRINAPLMSLERIIDESGDADCELSQARLRGERILSFEKYQRGVLVSDRARCNRVP